ncbi:translesion DNA synthesis-associated protein ImuA [Achromobacter sp. GG226]|uniref:translesion DNA synthesis-associated protein ImuA n=1 Tax=Verticiella alkaliphila TaxID=2779529 RepID=UPI001C0B43D8|nr:translesion DNA synthesis-associated protein ImuA [Verticiella sp. GG226]MBU4611604.1 translesion DNA synthesis-associated protein ImuA [Verticiella sp. GG226]
MPVAQVPSTAVLPHPALWRASQWGSPASACVDTGHAALSAELPGRGWPRGQLIELLVPRDGVGEVRLLQPALARVAGRRPVALVQPPHPPQAASWAGWQLDPARLLWVQPATSADALWAASQILKNGSCAALLCWLPQVRDADLRRLHVAAQASDVLFIGIRPVAAARQASPAPLRITVWPAQGGVLLRFVKRRGPVRDLPLHVAWPHAASGLSSSSSSAHVPLDRHLPAAAEPGRVAGRQPLLAG